MRWSNTSLGVLGGVRWSNARLGVLGGVLMAMAALFAACYRIAESSGSHSFDPGAQPPAVVRLTEGDMYQLSVPGGPAGLTKAGADPNAPRCTWSSAGVTSAVLAVQPLGADSKAIHAVATFVAPVTGRVRIDCANWGEVFVDDADGAGTDLAGIFVLAATCALTIGGALVMWALWRGEVAAAASRPGRGPGGIDDEDWE
jgi:hypothetical protein